MGWKNGEGRGKRGGRRKYYGRRKVEWWFEDIMEGGRWKGVGRYFGRGKVEGSRNILWKGEGGRK